VDRNGDGRADVGDGSTITPTLIQLVSWSRIPTSPADPAFPASIVNILTAEDGTFAFTNVPEGEYAIWIWWAGGFVNGATERLPDLFRAIVAVAPDGRITAPTRLPATWPESFGEEPIDVDKDRNSVGSLPSPLLLKPGAEGVVPYPVSTGGAPIAGTGHIDVSAYFAALDGVGPVGLPDTGGRRSLRTWWLAAIAVGFGLLGAIAVSARWSLARK
jgi:hypothetical protein